MNKMPAHNILNILQAGFWKEWEMEDKRRKTRSEPRRSRHHVALCARGSWILDPPEAVSGGETIVAKRFRDSRKTPKG